MYLVSHGLMVVKDVFLVFPAFGDVISNLTSFIKYNIPCFHREGEGKLNLG